MEMLTVVFVQNNELISKAPVVNETMVRSLNIC
jgi:hypothetical protein